ncbi:chromobox protein homolog 1 [Exaiptasia diaphana]|uniref:Chromo domain-containing protein n=1 Tax=Exaiptasia diaphana TaxID=2652724 RepID=A0A913WR29_EXADI|nr:chromobox protein homolog 1 [Exaiptasia diaphana]KXJ18593.1 Heterochromatin protein 1 [Exaiptasia diaphana]
MGKKKDKIEPTKQEPEVDSEELDEEEYEVEKVVDKRTVGGKVEYLLKWKNYPDSDNTWEAQEGLQCPELIEEFEKTRKEKKKLKSAKRKDSLSSDKEAKAKKRKVTSSSTESTEPSMVMKAVEVEDYKLDQRDPISEGWEAEVILGATEVDSQIHFLVQWKGTDRADLIPAKIANVKWPQIVIKFYEERVTWTNTENSAAQVKAS